MKSNARTRSHLQNQRIWSRADKLNYIRTYIDSDTESMLEMGPSIAPMWRTDEFKGVRYLESCDAAGLEERANLKGKTSPIEEVHYVFNPEIGFEGSIEHSAGYQYASSSHVIEHIPDFVGHLKSMEKVTNEQGYYFCICPDKNMIFDKFRPSSSLGDMVSHHVEERSALGAAIDTMFYAVDDKDTNRGWWNSNEEPNLGLRNNRGELSKLSVEKLKAGQFNQWYGHFHVFDPVGFSELIFGLRQMRLITLSLCDIVSTGHMDFIAVLKNDNGKSHMRPEKVQERLNDQNYPFLEKGRVA